MASQSLLSTFWLHIVKTQSTCVWEYVGTMVGASVSAACTTNTSSYAVRRLSASSIFTVLVNVVSIDPALELEKWFRKWSACLLPGLHLQHSHNCQVIMVAHFSSQLLEGIPGISCLARPDKSASSGFKWATLSQYMQWREIEEETQTQCQWLTSTCVCNMCIYAHTCACTPTIHIYTYPKILSQAWGTNENCYPDTFPQQLEGSHMFWHQSLSH